MNELQTSLESLVAQFEDIHDAYRPACLQFTRYLRGRGVPLTLPTVTDYFRELAASPLSAETVRVRRCAVKRRLRSMLEGADANEQDRMEKFFYKLDHDPDTKAPKTAPRSVGAEKMVQPDEYDRLCQHASARLGLCIAFLWSTGCRVSEMTGARLDRSRMEGDYVDFLVRGKGSKDRWVTIKREMFNEIARTFHGLVYLFETRERRQLGPNFVSRSVRHLGARVLHRKISAHSFRHSYATIQIRRTGMIEGVSRYLGHANVATTLQMYTHQELSRQEAVLA